MKYFLTQMYRLCLILPLAIMWGSNASAAPTPVTFRNSTNDLFVHSVRLHGDPSIEFYSGDPITYTVTYGRHYAASGATHQLQTFRVNIYLSTDGNADNQDNLLIDFFDDSFPNGTALASLYQRTITDLIPRNYEGNYYLIAAITATDDDFPSVFETATSRITIRSSDDPLASRVSETSDGQDANEYSEYPTVSDDGRYVAFQSEATNLDSDYTVTTTYTQVYLKDTVSGKIMLISRYAGIAGNEASRYPVISGDGRFVAFESSATNLISGTNNKDTNNQTDIYLYDVEKDLITRVSVRSDGGQALGGGCFAPTISGDGTYIAFESTATNLISNDTNGKRDIFVHNRITGTTTPVSCTASGILGNGDSSEPDISWDGSTVVFKSYAGNIAAGWTIKYTNAEILAKNIQNGAISRISVIRSLDTNGNAKVERLNRDAFNPDVSADGRYVAFASRASNIAAPDGTYNDSNYAQVYIVNRWVDAARDDTQSDLAFTADQLKAKATNTALNLVSRSETGLAANAGFGDYESLMPLISTNGRYVGFASEAAYLQNPTITRSDGVDFPIRSYGLSNLLSLNAFRFKLPIVITDSTGTGTGASGYALANMSSGRIQTIVIESSGLNYSTNPGDVTIEIDPSVSNTASATITANVDATTGEITAMVTDGGSGYTQATGYRALPDPVVVIDDSSGSGSGATAIVNFGTNGITDVLVTNGGSGYSTADGDVTVSLDLTGTGWLEFTAATLTATINSDTGAIESIAVTDPGDYFQYDPGEIPEVTISGGGGSGAASTALLNTSGGIREITVTNGGFGYNSNCQITISGGHGTGAEALPVVVDGVLVDIVVIDPGSGYTQDPLDPITVNIVGNPTREAVLIPVISKYQSGGDWYGQVTGFIVYDSGSGYTSSANITLAAPADGLGVESYAYATGPYLTFSDLDYPGASVETQPLTEDINPDTIPSDVLGQINIVDQYINYYTDTNNTSDVYVHDSSIQSVVISDTGEGYTPASTFKVTFEGGGGAGTETAKAWGWAIVDDFGRVSRIDIMDSGAGFYSTPTVVGLDSVVSTQPATAVAILHTGSERVSVNHFGMETIGILGGYQVPNSRSIAMSGDGRYMLFASEAANTSSFIFGKSNQYPLDQNDKRDIFMIDRRVGVLHEQSPSTVSITQPAVGANATYYQGYLSQPVNIVVQATAPDLLSKINQVELFANSVSIGFAANVTGSDYYKLTWIPTASGYFDLTAVATDSSGVSTSSLSVLVYIQPRGLLPSITLNSPVAVTDDNGQVTGIQTYTNKSQLISFVTANDADGELKSVDYYIDDQWVGAGVREGDSYKYHMIYSLSSLAVGNHSIYATATDSDGNVVSSAQQTFAIANFTAPAPSVTISNIIPDIPTATKLMSLDADVTLGFGANVQQIEFFINGVSAGTTNIAPYLLDYTPLYGGQYVVIAELTDTAGNRVASAPTTVSVTDAGSLPLDLQLISNYVTSTDFRDFEGEILISYLAVYGRYPTYTELQEAIAGKFDGTTDLAFVEVLINSEEYTNLYGDPIPSLTSGVGADYSEVKAFADRSFKNMNGRAPTSVESNTITQFFNTLVNPLETAAPVTPAVALITYVDYYFTGGKSDYRSSPTVYHMMLSRLRAAGVVLMVEHRTPTFAESVTLGNMALSDVIAKSLAADTDGDGKSNAAEYTLGTDPYVANSALDFWNLANFGTISTSGSAAPSADPDGDGLSNSLEYALGTDPNVSTSVNGNISIWNAYYFGQTNSTGNAAMTADPDHDGIPNLLEYAIGSNPGVANSSAPTVSAIDSSGHMTLTFNRIADTGLTYTVEAASSLNGSWSSIWTSTGASNVAGTVKVTDSASSTNSNAQRFLRLRVTK